VLLCGRWAAVQACMPPVHGVRSTTLVQVQVQVHVLMQIQMQVLVLVLPVWLLH
jgi:hypothetical protein